MTILNARLVVGYTEGAIPELASYEGHTLTDTFTGRELARRLERAVHILGKVIDQTEWRVFKSKNVPASEKVASLFEDHTDIIVKGCWDTKYRHEVFLIGGASTIILGCVSLYGATLLIPTSTSNALNITKNSMASCPARSLLTTALLQRTAVPLPKRRG
jgi:hypothetical protein